MGVAHFTKETPVLTIEESEFLCYYITKISVMYAVSPLVLTEQIVSLWESTSIY